MSGPRKYTRHNASNRIAALLANTTYDMSQNPEEYPSIAWLIAEDILQYESGHHKLQLLPEWKEIVSLHLHKAIDICLANNVAIYRKLKSRADGKTSNRLAIITPNPEYDGLNMRQWEFYRVRKQATQKLGSSAKMLEAMCPEYTRSLLENKRNDDVLVHTTGELELIEDNSKKPKRPRRK